MFGYTKEQRDGWALIRGQVYAEARAAGCCAEWLLRLARRPSLSAALAMLRSAEGMVFCATHAVPSLDALRAADALFNLVRHRVYIDGAGSDFERWRHGGAAIFAGAARSEVRCMQPNFYMVLALHGAELSLRAEGGARVQLYEGGGGRVEVQGVIGDSNVVRWDNAAARWREVRGGART